MRFVVWLRCAILLTLLSSVACLPAPRGWETTPNGRRVGGTLIPPGSGVLPINLAGGSGSVINVLPTGNQQAQSVGCSGDLSCSGTTTSVATTVESISGSTPLPVTPSLQWGSGVTNPTLAQASTSGATGQNFDFCNPQASTNGTAGTPGQCVANLPAPTGSSTTESAIVEQRGGTNLNAWGPHPGNGAFGDLWLGTSSFTAANFALEGNSGVGTILNAPTGLSMFFNVNNATQFQLNTTSANFYSGASILNPWQGTNNGQLQTVTYIPVICQTTTASATTCYTYSGISASHGVMLKLEAGGQFTGAHAVGAGCAATCVDASGTVTCTAAAASVYSIGSATCSFSASGTNVLVQVTSSISTTINWQGVLTANAI